jgi:hypothetical protein
LKVAGSNPEPAAPTSPQPAVPEPSMGDNMDTAPATDDKPFDDQPFDAGVEADEESDPKKFIEQLTGKLGQSLRAYTESQGQPDFDLEKFAINSLLSATHTAEMTPEDQKDIINKVKKSGAGDEDAAPEADTTPTDDLGGDEPSMDEPTDDLGGEEPTDELAENMAGIENNEFETSGLLAMKSLLHYAFDACKREGITPNEHDIFNYMQWYYTAGKNLNENDGGILSEFINPDKLKPLAKKPAISRDELHMILQMIYNSVDISGQYRIMDVYKALGFPFGEGTVNESKEINMTGATAFPWRYDSEDSLDGNIEGGEVGGIQEMDNLFLTNVPKNNLFQPGTEITEGCWKGYRQVGMKEKDGKTVPNCVPINENAGESKNYMFWQNLEMINHASGELLNMNQKEIDKMLENGHDWANDHVSKASDDIEEVYHFFDTNLSGVKVSKDSDKDLQKEEKFSIFDKDYLRQKLTETFNQDDSMIEPQVAPAPEVKPSVAPSPSISPKRKNQPFLPMPDVQPDPKAEI